MAELTALKNIGSEMNKKLQIVGIGTAEELKQRGSKEAYFLLKAHYPNVCLVHLYALQGAIDGVAYHQLPEETKAELKKFADGIK